MLMDDNPVSNGGKCGPLVGGSSKCSPTTRKVSEAILPMLLRHLLQYCFENFEGSR